MYNVISSSSSFSIVVRRRYKVLNADKMFKRNLSDVLYCADNLFDLLFPYLKVIL